VLATAPGRPFSAPYNDLSVTSRIRAHAGSACRDSGRGELPPFSHV